MSGDLAKIYNEDMRVILKARYLTAPKYWIGLVGLVWYWANGMRAQCRYLPFNDAIGAGDI